MLKLSAENQEEFERQLELAGFNVKWGNFHIQSKNRTYNPNSKSLVSTQQKNYGQNFETVDDIITKINMTKRDQIDEKVTVEQKQGFSFNPNDALDDFE